MTFVLEIHKLDLKLTNQKPNYVQHLINIYIYMICVFYEKRYIHMSPSSSNNEMLNLYTDVKWPFISM